MTADQDIWVLLDDRAGNRSQAMGVASRLGRPYREVEIRYGPLAALPNALLGAGLFGLDSVSKAALRAPWPKLVVAAGRRTAPAARWVKRRSGGTAKLLQVMDPGAGLSDFDLVCRPAHDGPARERNALSIAAAPHGWTRERLDVAAGEWRDRLGDLPSPRIALMIGGSTRRRRFTSEMATALCRQASAAATELGGSLMVSTSRRSVDAVNAVAAALSGPHRLYRWDEGGGNPYAGYLGLADALIVTGESVSMCSEACATGKPVYIFAPDALMTEKHARLHARLYERGHARPFVGAVDTTWSPAQLDVAADIAREAEARGLLP